MIEKSENRYYFRASTYIFDEVASATLFLLYFDERVSTCDTSAWGIQTIAWNIVSNLNLVLLSDWIRVYTDNFSLYDWNRIHSKFCRYGSLSWSTKFVELDSICQSWHESISTNFVYLDTDLYRQFVNLDNIHLTDCQTGQILSTCISFKIDKLCRYGSL